MMPQSKPLWNMSFDESFHLPFAFFVHAVGHIAKSHARSKANHGGYHTVHTSITSGSSAKFIGLFAGHLHWIGHLGSSAIHPLLLDGHAWFLSKWKAPQSNSSNRIDWPQSFQYPCLHNLGISSLLSPRSFSHSLGASMPFYWKNHSG